MSQENVEIVRRGIEAFNGGGPDRSADACPKPLVRSMTTAKVLWASHDSGDGGLPPTRAGIKRTAKFRGGGE